MKIQTILALTDLSANSVGGLELAQSAALRFHARVRVGYVYAEGKLFDRMQGQDPENVRRLRAWCRSDDLRQLTEVAHKHIEPLRLEGIDMVEASGARKGIGELIERAHPDLICMATRGRTGVRHVLLGSIAEYTLRMAGVPVMVTRGPTLPRPPQPLRVLLGLDLAEDHTALVEKTAGLLDRNDELVLGHAVEAAYLASSPYAAVSTWPGGMDVPTLLDEAEARLRETVPAGAHRHLEWHVTGDRPGPGMLELESRLRPHLIVARTHARKGAVRIVLGSVSEYLARHARGPVLVFPPD